MPAELKLLLAAIWAALALCLALTAFIIIYRAASRLVHSGLWGAARFIKGRWTACSRA